MIKSKYKHIISMMLRINDLEKLLLNPKLTQILDYKDYIKLPDERDELLNIIEKCYPKQIRC